jgi:hypothetical protein
MLEHKRKIKISPDKVLEWDQEIKAMISEYKITSCKFKAMILWYKDHMSDKYVPRINGGKCLRDKWCLLCNAHARANNRPIPYPNKKATKQTTISIVPKGEHNKLLQTKEGIIKARLNHTDDELRDNILRGFEYHCNVSYPQSRSYVPVKECVDELLQVMKELKAWSVYWMDKVSVDPRRAVSGQWLYADLVSTSSGFGETYGQYLGEQKWISSYTVEAIRPGGHLFNKFFDDYCEAKGIMKPC